MGVGSEVTLHLLTPRANRLHHRRVQQRLDRAKVIADGRETDPRRRRDIAGGSARIALLIQTPLRARQQRFPIPHALHFPSRINGSSDSPKLYKCLRHLSNLLSCCTNVSDKCATATRTLSAGEQEEFWIWLNVRY